MEEVLLEKEEKETIGTLEEIHEEKNLLTKDERLNNVALEVIEEITSADYIEKKVKAHKQFERRQRNNSENIPVEIVVTSSETQQPNIIDNNNNPKTNQESDKINNNQKRKKEEMLAIKELNSLAYDKNKSNDTPSSNNLTQHAVQQFNSPISENLNKNNNNNNKKNIKSPKKFSGLISPRRFLHTTEEKKSPIKGRGGGTTSKKKKDNAVVVVENKSKPKKTKAKERKWGENKTVDEIEQEILRLVELKIRKQSEEEEEKNKTRDQTLGFPKTSTTVDPSTVSPATEDNEDWCIDNSSEHSTTISSSGEDFSMIVLNDPEPEF